MIKTVELDGAETHVTELGGSHTVAANFGSAAVYASERPGIVPGSDGVAEIPAGSAVILRDTNGEVYLLGTGRVQCEGTCYADVNISLAPAGGGSTDNTPTPPQTEMMPCMDGVTHLFVPDTLDIGNSIWRNRLNYSDIELTGGAQADKALRLNQDSYGRLTLPTPPKVMYALIRQTELLSQTGSVLCADVYPENLAFNFKCYKAEPNDRFYFTANEEWIDGDQTPMTEYQVLCAVQDASGKISFYINGELCGTTQKAFYMTSSYKGQYLLNKKISGEAPQDGICDWLALAVGFAPHTGEQIKDNSRWLKQRYLGGD